MKVNSIQKITAFLTAFALMLPMAAMPVSAQNRPKSGNALTEDQKIQHVLNRLAFGARPGDIENIKSIGLMNYIDMQLNPAAINDQVAEAKLVNFSALKMSNEELFAKYPNPGALLQIVAQEMGMTRRDLQQARAERQNAQMPKEDGAMMGDKPTAPVSPDQMDEADRKMVQQKIQEMYKKYDLKRPQEISQQLNASRILRAVYSERQLNEVMVDFWTNHFNVYANKQSVRWFLPEYDRDVIRPNAMGNFKDLLLATAKSPAMLYYLDNFESVSPNAEMPGQRANAQNMERLKRAETDPKVREQIKRNRGLNDQQLDDFIKRAKQNMGQAQNRMKRGINENYAREIMELHTLGVDGGYTQKDVQEVARAFTGWTIVDARGYRKAAAKMISGNDNDKRYERMARQMGIPDNVESGSFFFNENWHDKGEKTVLGQKINESGMNDGLKVIDILVKHPSTAKFIAKKLAVKFVNDNPSEALVSRVADAFSRSSGDIKTTLRALFTDPEFFAPENYRVKIKTPFEVVVSGVRTLGAETNGMQLQAALFKMGEPLYGWQAPTGFPDTAEDWVNTGALLERMNFAVSLASNRIPGTKVDLAKLAGSTEDKHVILDKLVGAVLHGEISTATKSTLMKQMDQPLPEPSYAMTDDGAMENASMERPMMDAPGQNAGPRRGQGQQLRLLPPSGNPEQFKVAGLILGSPEFQRQ